jgi:predicted dehydrogenase
MSKKLSVVVVGLGFGRAFVPIYQHHPDVGCVAVFDPDITVESFVTRRYGLTHVYDSFEQILEDETVDAVHLVTPIPLHEEQTVQVLETGKHCACTVPMGLSLDKIQKIIDAVDMSKKNYMMMETAVYTRHFFHAKDMLDRNEIGRIQFLRGAHYQDMENWPSYWMGLPPMYYATHAIAPLVMCVKSPIVRTHCFGSGVMREELTKQYDNPYPVECAIFEFANGIKAEVTRSLFQTARTYTESFSIYGEYCTFEWPQLDCEQSPVIHALEPLPEGWRGKPTSWERVTLKNYDFLLPEAIRPYTVRNRYHDASNPEITFEEGGGHDGSHPHLVHEFIRSIVEKRKPWINEQVAANITAAGICAHTSAMQNGSEVRIPYTFQHT